MQRVTILRAELSGAATLSALALTTAIAIGFLPGIGDAAGYFGSTRRWLSAALVLASVVLAMAGSWVRAGLFGLIALLAALSTLPLTSLGAAPQSGDEGRRLKVVAWNVFGENFDGAPSIAQRLLAEQADILVLTEAHALEPYWGDLRAAYPYVAGCEEGKTCIFAVLSRYPLAHTQVTQLGLPLSEPAITTVADVQGREVGIAAVHLAKPWTERFAIQQLDELRHLLRGLPETRIIAGDLNSASWAPDLALFLKEQNLGHAWPEPATWPVELGFFGIPIDHIYSGGAARVVSVQAIDDPMGSNHRGIIGEVAIGNQ